MLKDKLNARIQSLELGDSPPNLYEPVRYMLSLGGKRMRPLLVLLGYSLKKADPETILDPSLVVEIFHNFTLMHDDIMDEAPLRRGQPTVHEKWGAATAILSGDTMMVKSYDLMLSIAPDLLPTAIQKFNRCAVEVCEGQQMDMDFEQVERVSEEEYLEMIRLKTAVLLGFSLEYGGLLAGMDEEEQRQLKDIGEQAGIGFQLMDDLLDVYGDRLKFGKQVGGDIVSNKKTYLLIKALELANETQLDELKDWLSRKEFDPEEKVEAVKNIYDEIGIYELTQQKMNGYYDRAFALLDSLEARPQGKAELMGFFQKLMKRDR